MTKAYLVPAEGRCKRIEIDGLEDMQNAVGGYIEAIPWLFGNKPAAYCNEEGKLVGLPPNRVIVHEGSVVDIVFGNLLFCGLDENGDTVDITDEEIERVKSRFGGSYPHTREGAGSGIAECMRIAREHADGR